MCVHSCCWLLKCNDNAIIFLSDKTYCKDGDNYLFAAKLLNLHAQLKRIKCYMGELKVIVL